MFFWPCDLLLGRWGLHCLTSAMNSASLALTLKNQEWNGREEEKRERGGEGEEKGRRREGKGREGKGRERQNARNEGKRVFCVD